MTFPFTWRLREVTEGDLTLFAQEFADIVAALLPCRDVRFVAGRPGVECEPAWQAGVEAVHRERQPVVESGDGLETLFLPLWSGTEALLGVAILAGKPGSFSDASVGGLLAKSRTISAQLARVKQLVLDPLTGLPGGLYLERRLGLACGRGEADQGAAFVLCFLEVSPRVRDAAHFLADIAGRAAFLDSLIGHLCVLCHLGNGLFAFLLEKTGEAQARKLAEMLLRWLKREGVPRAAIGMAAGGPEKGPVAADCLPEQAWDALTIARKRAPFALCSFQGAEEKAAHPLCPPAPRVVAALRRHWRDVERGVLLLLRADQPGQSGAVPWQECLDRPFVAMGEQEAFVVLADCDAAEAEGWCRDLRQRGAPRQLAFSIGAAVYPQGRFRKADLPLNCRKALIHAGFLGSGALVFFNGVSLNISGDIYYNEGDLARAVREYRLGLELAPDNANLHNSLGVSFAQMNLYKKAIPLFQRVLDLSPADFMALFNLGFAWLACRQEEKALQHLERALAVDDTSFDLLLQLGKLYCKAGRYGEAVRVLSRGERIGPVGTRDISHGAVHRYLGEAHMGLGENGSAMASLQRAVRHNPRDATALSLLGELYCHEGQGNDIARALCHQAVLLEEGCWEHWNRLARVLERSGHDDESLAAAEKACRLAPRKTEPLVLLAGIYRKTGQEAAAAKICRKILRRDPQHRLATAMLVESGADNQHRSDHAGRRGDE